MQGNVFVNEVRIPLRQVQTLTALQYRTSGLSTAYRRRLERLLGLELELVAIFEGNVLFCLAAGTDSVETSKRRLSEFLSERIRSFNADSIQSVTLTQMPERVAERLLFAVISFLAEKRNVFTIYGRTLFTPTPKAGKLGHSAVEITMTIEDDFVKLYLNPTLIALVNIHDTYRAERHDLELVGLCTFRVGCDLAEENGSCPYVCPGKLGYYEQEALVEHLPKDRQEGYKRAFKGCPRISGANKAILVKASKKAANTLAYPPYIVHARLSRMDLQAKPEVARVYRQETLTLSGRRWNRTNQRLSVVFGNTGELEVGNVKIPIEIILHRPHPIQGDTNLDYKAIWIPQQPIVNDQQNPRGKSQSGGWLFREDGAYDREDVERPFDRVHPYLIVPKNDRISTLGRSLLAIFSDSDYVPRLARNDQGFTGLNRPESQRKYHCGFVNVWEEEEGVFLVDGSEADYWRAVQDVKREWNKSMVREPENLNRIAVVIVPSSTADDEENALYYRLKKVFVEEGLPSQFITTGNLYRLEDESFAFGPVLHSLWLNIYAKLGGKPWRLANRLGNVHCFVGIGFGLNPRRIGRHIYAGVAHVFDRYGSWIDLASEAQPLTADDRESFEGSYRYLQGTSSFKISQSLTQQIVYDALRLYQKKQSETREPAENIVLHKLGQVYECEIVGFLEGIRQTLGSLSRCRLGILQIEQEHQVRLYGDPVMNRKKEDRTVFRGTALTLNQSRAALATTGRISRHPFYYPGIGTPRPLLLTARVPSEKLLREYGCDVSQFYDIETLVKHVMALTQLHWGSTRENIRLPITTLYAHKVADLISKTGANINTWSSYYRPWFL